jgi:D-aminopeptidase
MPLIAAGRDVWRLACHRSLDAPAPGNWTLRINRAPGGGVEGIAVGCWLARNVIFKK